ncbi:MAG: GAP family protein [Candidatus Geothermincolia bacterium]
MILKLAPLAIFWAVSPLTIVIGIMFLSGSRGLLKGLAFVLPGVLGSIGVGIIVLLTANARDFSHKTNASTVAYIGQLVVALLFFGFAFFWWRIQSKRDKQPRMPKWVQFLDSFKPSRVLAIGLYEFLSDALFTVAAVVDILLARIGAFEGILITVIFVLVGMVGLWIPIFVRVVSPAKSASRLESMRQWLLSNTQMILVFEFACLGVIEALKGLVGLLT